MQDGSLQGWKDRYVYWWGRHMRERNGKGTLVRRMLLGALVVIIAFCSVQVNKAERERSVLKADLKEINSITYGLFNVDVWRDVLVQIVVKKVRALHIDANNRAQLKQHIEELLYKTVDEMQAVVEKRNKRTGFSGLMRQLVMDIFVDIKTIRSGVPRYADLMLDYLNDPKNRNEITGMVVEQFDALANKTVGEVDYTELNAVFERCGYANKRQCAAYLQARIDGLDGRSGSHMWALVASAVALLGLIVFRSGASTYELLLLVSAGGCLLFNGVALPMIDIEATISDFSLQLMGEPVVFKDQVLFYQSKSILQVVHVLITDGSVGLVSVGVLVLVFSVLFPVSKIIASLITIHSGKAPTNKLHRFLVFKSGKWSMADVMVVAIFMAFIGFSGIVTNQLEVLRNYTDQVEMLTTNNSGLRMGFYLFAMYCVVGLLLSTLVERRLNEQQLGGELPDIGERSPRS